MPMCYDKFFERIKNKSVNNGITTYSLRKNRYIAEATLQSMRKGEPIRMEVLCRLCYLMKCQPNDIMEYISDDQDILKD